MSSRTWIFHSPNTNPFRFADNQAFFLQTDCASTPACHKKTLLPPAAGFVLVDYTIEISNLDLVKDLAKIIDFVTERFGT